MSPSSASDDSSAAPVPVAAARARIVGALPRHTSRLVLRELTLADIEAVHAYRSLPEVTRYLGHPPLDPDGTRDLVHRWLGDPAALSVALELGGEVIGDMRLWFRRSSAMSPAVTEEVDAGLGYALHPDHQRRGLATEAVGEVVQLVLDAGGVRRITARVFAAARPSSALLRRLGFHLDGVDRAAVLAPEGGAWWDDECWSLLQSDG
ncbi:GNAT family N-acetyltransferase [Ornithinimicrobium sufpigmenti]|uniref:GNAT family N-acetyltransferase n=1 Tax=Ornithinimicrobium sufpigmenti TaxID=2508882 RepID=UPI0015E1B3E9|nr:MULTISPECIES: GNAT family protein [unclassified Ornithinimicrobium]